MAFLKTILILLLIYFGVTFLLRLFKPYLIRYASRKMDERFQNMFRDYSTQNQHQPREKEGKISIDKIPRQPKKSKNVVGEYIEYEEID